MAHSVIARMAELSSPAAVLEIGAAAPWVRKWSSLPWVRGPLWDGFWMLSALWRQSALSIQNPSQSGPRTHGNDDHFRTHGAAAPISSTAAGEESSAIRAITECAIGGALRFIYQAPRYLWICISTPPPVALTSRPCCVAETRTITPA